MELVLTEKRGGGYQAHRPTCKKMGDKEQFDAEELTTDVLAAATACSSCKPKDEDMDSMLATTPPAQDKPALPSAGEPVSEGDDEELWDDDLVGADADGLEQETTASVDEDGLEPEVTGDEDLIGEEPPAPRSSPKPKPAEKPAKGTEVKAEEAWNLLVKVFEHLSLPQDGIAFPGFGKAVKTVDKQTVYLNSKGTADVRANSPEQAAQWVEAGLAVRRGGNYVRVAVRDL